MSIRIECQPPINGDVSLGGPCKQSLWIGRTIDGGRPRPVYFDADENFVVLELGKRGSGKSFGLGSALEAFATEQSSSSIARHGAKRRGVLLLDPLDVHWTAIYPVRDGMAGPMQEQFKLVKNWQGGSVGNLGVEPIRVAVFMPAGKRRPDDPPEFIDYFLPVTDLTPADFALLLGANLVTDPAGMLIDEVYDKVVRLGFTSGRIPRPPRAVFGLQDLIDCLEEDEVQQNYAPQTVRAVRQRLLSWQRDPLFQQNTGTPIAQLIASGQLTILCLNRLSEDMRSVLTAVVVRKLKAERTNASQVERRLAFDPSATVPRDPQMPRTILAIDEAQMILPASGGGHARSAIESYILEGRNFGLSIWMATQRPKGAISDRAISQLDTLIVHRLSTADDLDAASALFQSALPQSMKVNDRPVELREMLRSLDTGMAMVSSDRCTAGRAFVMEVRPRVVAHGGKAF